jgi:cobalamin biosynthesis protein CobT
MRLRHDCSERNTHSLLTQGLEKVVSLEIQRRVGRVQRPPVVDEDIGDAQDSDQQTGTPLGLESDGDHDASGKSEKRDNGSEQGEFPLEGESDEKEDEEDSSSELEAAFSKQSGFSTSLIGGSVCRLQDSTYYFLRSVSLMLGSPANNFLFFWSESERTIRSPPMTERFRRKKDMSKIKPYPRPAR